MKSGQAGSRKKEKIRLHVEWYILNVQPRLTVQYDVREREGLQVVELADYAPTYVELLENDLMLPELDLGEDGSLS